MKTSGRSGRHIRRRNLLRVDGKDRGRVDAEVEFVVDRRHGLPTNHDLQGDVACRVQLDQEVIPPIGPAPDDAEETT